MTKQIEEGLDALPTLKAKAAYFILMQGLGVAVLTVWVYMLNVDVKTLKSELSNCQTEKYEIQRQQNTELIRTLNDLTNAINRK